MIKLFRWFFGMCVQHEWKLAYETVLESGFEQMTKRSKRAGDFDAPIDFFENAVVLTFQCCKCSEMRVVTRRLQGET